MGLDQISVFGVARYAEKFYKKLELQDVKKLKKISKFGNKKILISNQFNFQFQKIKFVTEIEKLKLNRKSGN